MLEPSDHPPRPSLTAPEIERPAFLCFQKLEVRLAAEPATGHGPDDPICHRSFRIRDFDSLPARTGCRSVCHKLHLAGLLQGDEKVNCRLDVGSADQDSVVLGRRSVECATNKRWELAGSTNLQYHGL